MRAELLEVGTIAKAHGLKGEVIVKLLTDHTERLDPGSVLQTDRGPLTVVSAHPHQHRWRVFFEGVHSREDAEALHGLKLRAEPIDDPDEWYVHDLIGSSVVLADGSAVGTCTAIVANPAHDMIEIDGGPVVPMPFVVGFADGVITIDPPEGLFDI